jgi:hypothetical protein
VSPGPGAVDPEDGLPALGDEAGGDMEEPVAEGLGFGSGEVAVEAEQLGPGQQAAGQKAGGGPGLVAGEVFEGQVGEARISSGSGPSPRLGRGPGGGAPSPPGHRPGCW